MTDLNQYPNYERQQSIPPDPGVAGWQAVLPARPVQAVLQGESSADYAIIGAGFAGLSAARRLRQLQPEAAIAVLEAREVATGPAGRNSGFMIDLPHDLSSDDYAGSSAEHDQRQTRLNRAAIDFALAAANEYDMPVEAITAVGKINAAATDKGLQHNADYAQHLQRLGEEFRLLGASQMQALTGVQYYQGGLWTPGTAMLQPALYIRELVAGLLRAGVNLYEHSAVTRLQRLANRWHVSTDQGVLRAKQVIVANNGLVQQFGFYPRQLMHVFTYASMTRALTTQEVQALGGQSQWGVTPADPMGSTIRRVSGIGGERVVVRNRFTYDPKIQVSQSRMASVARSHRTAFEARFPMLAAVPMEYVWGGRLCLSLNGVFALGQLQEGLYSACCQNGLGTAKGTVAGIIAAEMAADAEVSLLPDFVPEAAPQRLWPEPFMAWGANAYLRWKEFRAGRDF